MHPLRLILALSAVLAAGPFASADTINYALNGTLLNGTFSGAVSFDTVTGDLVGTNFNVSADGVFDTYTGLPDSVDISPFYTGYTFTGSAGNEFLLAIPTSTLTDYPGSELCSISSVCLDNNYLAIATAFAVDPNTTVDYATFGQLSPQLGSSVAPEPGTLLLLATGVLCIMLRLEYLSTLGSWVRSRWFPMQRQASPIDQV